MAVDKSFFKHVKPPAGADYSVPLLPDRPSPRVKIAKDVLFIAESSAEWLCAKRLLDVLSGKFLESATGHEGKLLEGFSMIPCSSHASPFDYNPFFPAESSIDVTREPDPWSQNGDGIALWAMYPYILAAHLKHVATRTDYPHRLLANAPSLRPVRPGSIMSYDKSFANCSDEELRRLLTLLLGGWESAIPSPTATRSWHAASSSKIPLREPVGAAFDDLKSAPSDVSFFFSFIGAQTRHPNAGSISSLSNASSGHFYQRADLNIRTSNVSSETTHPDDMTSIYTSVEAPSFVQDPATDFFYPPEDSSTQGDSSSSLTWRPRFESYIFAEVNAEFNFPPYEIERSVLTEIKSPEGYKHSVTETIVSGCGISRYFSSLDRSYSAPSGTFSFDYDIPADMLKDGASISDAVIYAGFAVSTDQSLSSTFNHPDWSDNASYVRGASAPFSANTSGQKFVLTSFNASVSVSQNASDQSLKTVSFSVQADEFTNAFRRAASFAARSLAHSPVDPFFGDFNDTHDSKSPLGLLPANNSSVSFDSQWTRLSAQRIITDNRPYSGSWTTSDSYDDQKQRQDRLDSKTMFLRNDSLYQAISSVNYKERITGYTDFLAVSFKLTPAYRQHI